MCRDFALDHVALALANGPHIGGDVAGYDAEARALARQMPDPCAPNFVFAGEAGDVGARAADPLTLDYGRSPARLRHVPSQQLAALSAPEDQYVNLFRSRHEFSPLLLALSCPDRPIDRLCITCCSPSQPPHHAGCRCDLGRAATAFGIGN